MTLSVIIPTAGRPSLVRTLRSCAGDWQPGDELVIACDTHEWTPGREWFAAVCAATPPFVTRTVLQVDAGRHDWGHSQINAAQQQAAGGWLVYQDDDDIFTPRALSAIRRQIAQLARPAPLLFRFMTHFGVTVWNRPGVLEVGTIGGHCLVLPNLKERLGRWTERYEGDYDAVVESVARWHEAGVDPVWCPDLIALARPPGGEQGAGDPDPAPSAAG